jgi:hypothetical protein
MPTWSASASTEKLPRLHAERLAHHTALCWHQEALRLRRPSLSRIMILPRRSSIKP